MTRLPPVWVVPAAAVLLGSLPACSGGQADGAWTALGPEGGTVLTVAADPDDSDTVYAGTLGGVFTSTDGGDTWSRAGAGPREAVLELSIDPSSPRTIFAGTDSGVYLSHDAGSTWTESDGIDAPVYAVSVDPDNASVVYAGTGAGLLEMFPDEIPGLFRSTDGGRTWRPGNGGLERDPGGFLGGAGYPETDALLVVPGEGTVYAGTLDGLLRSGDAGKTWTSGTLDAAVHALTPHPTDPDVLFAATEKGIFRSGDRGATWSELGRTGEALGLAVDSGDPATLYASTESGVLASHDGGESWTRAGLEDVAVVTSIATHGEAGALMAGTADQGFFTSTDGGKSWNPSNAGLTAVAALSLAVDPEASDNLVLGSPFGLERSDDRGRTWREASAGMATFGLAYVTSLVFDSSEASIAYAGGEGGVLESRDGGRSWHSLADPSDFTSVSALAIDAASPGTLYAGASSGFFASTDGGIGWEERGEGLEPVNDILSIGIDPKARNVLYVGTDDSGVYKSSDAGASWAPLRGGLPCESQSEYAECSPVRALLVDEEAPSTLLAATATGVYTSTDAGATWAAANDGLSTAALAGAGASALLADPRSPSRLFVGAGDGVYASSDGGRSWRSLEGLEGQNVVALALDADNRVLYACTAAGVYARRIAEATQPPATTEATEPATPVATPVVDLSNAHVHSFATILSAPKTVYAGTGDGVVKSLDGGATWHAAGVDGELVESLAVDPRSPDTVYAAAGEVLRSRDGGRTWALAIACPTCELHRLGQVSAVAVDPARPETVYAGAFSGVAKSTDGGETWAPANVGLPDDPGVGSLVVDPHRPRTVFAGSAKGLFATTDGGGHWTRVRGGFPGGVAADVLAADPDSPGTIYAAADYGFESFVSSDGGRAWHPLGLGGWRQGTMEALAVDPDRSNVLYAELADAAIGGRGRVVESSDGGRSWASVNPPIRTGVFALAVVPGTHVLLVGTQDSGVVVRR